MTDTPLLEWRDNLPPDDDPKSIRWEECKRDQPQFLVTCYQLCLRAKRKGFERWSADAMFHVLRWETSMSTNDSEFKIDNNHSSYASRDLMKQYPDLKGFFETRKQKPKRKDLLPANNGIQ